MAHHFVKWWRNKFRNGYKKFSAGMDSERTDTEELVGRAASQCSAPPDLLPSEARALLQPSTTSHRRIHSAQPEEAPQSPQKHSNDKPSLRFEELTCDVELQHPAPSKQQPLQFSFTLYDLDGHGRMTKDDIAGIVSTIYESIGKSVTVPHYGSKTIQVRLTVVPEDSNSRNERREGKRRRRHRQHSATAAQQEFVDASDDEERSRLSPDDDASSKSSCSGERITKPTPPKPSRHTKKEHRERKHAKKRSGSLQRRELLEIIQANMEKNHLNFQTSRKPSEHVVLEEEVQHKYRKLRNRSYTVSEKPVVNTFHSVKTDNHRNGYLDLASGGDSNLCRYDRYLHAVICSSARHANTGYHQKQTPRLYRQHNHRGHNRSRSHELTQTPRVLQIIFL